VTGGRHRGFLVRPVTPFVDEAACRDFPEVDFHPHRNGDPLPALTICRACPVRVPCLAYALEHGEVGVWGATTDKMRRRMNRRGVPA